ncbi:hypothetical protein L0337_20600 [candidate division KSB1 bacterium]|nr:hypothetical protein [candidate division KSB1 bacterium]
MKKYWFVVVACLTLGLAPFFPEPHVVGKIRWILGGAKDMAAIDWWDTFQHGLPWLVLIYFIVRDLLAKRRGQSA